MAMAVVVVAAAARVTAAAVMEAATLTEAVAKVAVARVAAARARAAAARAAAARARAEARSAAATRAAPSPHAGEFSRACLRTLRVRPRAPQRGARAPQHGAPPRPRASQYEHGAPRAVQWTAATWTGQHAEGGQPLEQVGAFELGDRSLLLGRALPVLDIGALGLLLDLDLERAELVVPSRDA
eukprot:scaffold105077_cov42-Phaeocystis_antarctica.AAC.1